MVPARLFLDLTNWPSKIYGGKMKNIPISKKLKGCQWSDIHIAGIKKCCQGLSGRPKTVVENIFGDDIDPIGQNHTL